jgi:iron(III) transport system substrate-binding protein
MLISRRSLLLGAPGVLLGAAPARAAETVNVYTYRQPQLVEPLFAAFTERTGIQVRTLFSEKGLIERMEQEGALSPADVLLSADVGRLVAAAAKGLAQPVNSPIIDSAVPINLRASDQQWFGLTMRARVIYASNDRVKQTGISYEELADPKWRGKICIRPGNHPYNLGLIGAMIAKRGEAATKQWLLGLKANLAIKPSGNDRAQAKSVFSGECDLAIANTYYMGLMQTNEKEPEQKEWAKAARIIFPSSAEMGTHVNVSGMLMAKHAPNAGSALKLMEFLVSDEAQKIYAASNFEYPVNPNVQPSDIVAAWGTFTPDRLNVAEIAKYEIAAAKMVDDVQFNE